MNVFSTIFEHSASLPFSFFTRYILALNLRAYFMTDFRRAHIFCVKKTDNRANFAACGITNYGKHHNSLCRDKNKHQMTGYMMLYMALNHVTLLRMRELSSDPTLVA
jgi:hypothetical protein